MTSKLVTLIETLEPRGAGTPGDPCRTVTQWWTTDGVFVVEKDPVVQFPDLHPRDRAAST